MDLLCRALEAVPPEVETLRAWWEATAAARAAWSTTIERAVIGGALADRLGFAFAGGYHEALRALVPTSTGEITALCATEDKGNAPRAIQTALTPEAPGRYRLAGTKKWATVASEASVLLVVASTGHQAGRNQLRVVRVRTDAPGVTLRTSAAPFVPEVPHAEVELDTVVREEDLLPGDGYDAYLKPFRTVEDLHVHGALLGYLIGVARRHGPRAAISGLAASLTTIRALAGEDPTAAATHLALGGAIAQVAQVVAAIEAGWSEGAEHARWQRDRSLLKVAGSARTARLARAFERLGL